jgi:hypothetical protein
MCECASVRVCECDWLWLSMQSAWFWVLRKTTYNVQSNVTYIYVRAIPVPTERGER